VLPSLLVMPLLMATSVIQDALGLLRDQSVTEAIDCLESAVVATPAYPAAYVLLARAYESRKDWGAARSAWEQAFILMPHSPTVQEGRKRVRTVLREQRQTQQPPSRPGARVPRPESGTAKPSEPLPRNVPSDEEKGEAALPSLSMDEGPADLDALRAQTEHASHQQHPSPPDAEAFGPSLDDIDDDLDHLIEELQSARIRPDPTIDDLPDSELDDDIEDMVSETLARIYASQGAYHEAARVYVQLAVQKPEQSESLLREASKMRQKARENPSDDETGTGSTSG
jgi:tetratricopeptide (TPR) repeat protein